MPREGSSSPLPTRRRSTEPVSTGGGSVIARQDFPKTERVTTRAEISKVFDAGRRYSCKGLRLHALANERGLSRIAIVPVRSYPSAVARNRIKRVLREAWRLAKADFASTGFDCVLVAYPGEDDYRSRSSQLRRLLGQAGVLRVER